MRKEPKAGTRIACVLAFMREEGGRWTAAGIAEELGDHPHAVSKNLNQLRDYGLVRRVEWREQPGHPAGVFEVVDEA